MSERRYEIPNLLHRMVKSDSWPIAVIYRDDEPRVEVECGRWGLNGGWVRNSYWYPKDEIPEARVIDLYATKPAPQPDGGDGAVLVGYTTPAIIERALAQGRSPGLWLKSEGDEVPVYAYTRPAATAAVPDEPDPFLAIERAVASLPPGYAFQDAVEHAAPAAPKGGVVDEAMARRYLAAQKDYIGKVDAAFGRQVAGALHGDDVIGACMAGLTAALANQEQRS